MAVGIADARMRRDFDPFLGSAGALVPQPKVLVRTDRVNPPDPHRVAGAGDGGEIMGFVDAVHHHRQIGLASIQYLDDPLIAWIDHLIFQRLVPALSENEIFDRPPFPRFGVLLLDAVGQQGGIAHIAERRRSDRAEAIGD
jgi:hypothetical protein